jgi:uncharacterized Fe-S cluster protein YjdI
MDKNDIKKEYTNGEITIVWKSDRCIHSGNCVRGNPEVFHPKEHPWVQPGNSTTQKIKNTIDNCPSGALTYYLNKNNNE